MSKKYECDCDVIHSDVVEHVKANMSEKDEYIALAGVFKLFGDATRLQILHALEKHEMCVCDLAALLNMTKSAISHQLKSLRMANLVRFRREGQNIFYSLADEHVRMIIDVGYEHLNE